MAVERQLVTAWPRKNTRVASLENVTKSLQITQIYRELKSLESGQTDRQTDTHTQTDRQTTVITPLVHAPRVNKGLILTCSMTL